MTLTIRERLLLLTVLPREGSLADIRIISKLRESLSLSEEEHKRIGIVEKDGGLSWRDDVPQEAEVEIGPRAHVLIQDALKLLDRQSKLTEDLLPIYDRLVTGD